MKHLTIILILTFISCKNINKAESKSETETKTEIESESETELETESGIDKSVYEMWNNYIEANPEFKNEVMPESEFFHNNREDANRLAELTANGKKKASSGLYSLYKQYNVEIPKVGKKQIITDFDGKAKVIIENTSVDTIPFNKISKEYAELDMGTDIEPLEKWKKAHWDFFESFLEESGEKPTDEMLIVCVRFKPIWTEKY
ncbi:RNA-binding protein [Winogradskyella sp. J14-2]|uniref:ASCH domain-containing protein n=1 Tax=Winogradskyella sp. J14-2 TaxID=1936080 RepID=UPI00097288FB|nr:ASCH domain-containing protein [Winogradskyella sp. J14-2]APY09543.1 RNA-binding protein [Winogradskyella sp. J14-2]